MKNNRGMTLVEALIGNFVLAIVIFASLGIFKDLTSAQINSETYLNLIVARNRLINHILDARTWGVTITAPENTALNCLLNQDSVPVGARDCKATLINQAVNIYSLDATDSFPFKNGSLGIDMTGKVCNTFVPPPAAGNPLCPMGVNLSVSAQCDGSPNCVNPPLALQAQFTMNGDAKAPPLNAGSFNFDLVAAGIFCPTQVGTPIGLVPAPPDITVTPTSVNGIAAASALYAQTAVALTPCRRVTVDFTIDSSNYDASVANNQTKVCLADSSAGTCAATLIHTLKPDGTYTYDLYDGATLKASKPSWLNLSGGEAYEFDVFNGMVKFCVDLHCYYYFESKVEGPFRVRFYPARVASPLPIIDNFSVTLEEI